VFGWKIVKLEVEPFIDGLPDVVVGAEWICSAEDKGSRADCNGYVDFPKVNPMSFTQYQSLTEEQVMNWLWSCVNKDQIEQLVSKQLQNKINPNPSTPPLPWE